MVDKYLQLAIGGGSGNPVEEQQDWNGNVEVVCRDAIFKRSPNAVNQGLAKVIND